MGLPVFFFMFVTVELILMDLFYFKAGASRVVPFEFGLVFEVCICLLKFFVIFYTTILTTSDGKTKIQSI